MVTNSTVLQFVHGQDSNADLPYLVDRLTPERRDNYSFTWSCFLRINTYRKAHDIVMVVYVRWELIRISPCFVNVYLVGRIFASASESSQIITQTLELVIYQIRSWKSSSSRGCGWTLRSSLCKSHGSPH